MVQSFEGITSNLASQNDFEFFEIIEEELSVLAKRVNCVFFSFYLLTNICIIIPRHLIIQITYTSGDL